jgi:hypothetical protein
MQGYTRTIGLSGKAISSETSAGVGYRWAISDGNGQEVISVDRGQSWKWTNCSNRTYERIWSVGSMPIPRASGQTIGSEHDRLRRSDHLPSDS